MRRKKKTEQDRMIELLEKMLVFQLYDLGISQGRIAKTIGKQINWVNDLVKGIAKGGKSDVQESKPKKTGRPRRR